MVLPKKTAAKACLPLFFSFLLPSCLKPYLRVLTVYSVSPIPGRVRERAFLRVFASGWRTWSRQRVISFFSYARLNREGFVVRGDKWDMILRFRIRLLYVPIRCTARSREKLAAYVLASLQMYSKNDKLLPPLPRSIRFLPFSFPHTLLSCPLSRSPYNKLN